MDNNFYISYRINERNEIVFVNDYWSDFAIANGASDIIRENVLQRSLWNFISDSTIEDVYREILRQVRDGRSMQFNIRCDSPELRRLLHLSISLQQEGDVLFESRPIRIEARPSQIILTREVPRTDELMIVCSWCKKVDVGKENWQEVEEAVKTLGLFQTESQPLISHGMCYACYQAISKKLKNI